MKKCNQKIKHTCGSIVFADCTSYEGILPEFSELECPSIEETTTELYELIGVIKEETDLSELGNQCLDYLKDDNDKIVVKNVLLKHEEEICLLKERVEFLENRQLCDFPISSCGINLDCLSLPCDQSIATVADLFNALITKVCETP